MFRLIGLKVIQTWHEPYTVNKSHRLKSFLYFLFMSLGATGLVFVRQDYVGILSNTYRRIIKRIPQVVIQNATPLPKSLLSENQGKQLRSKYLGPFRRLVVFFGFVYPDKGIELIFNIANPLTDSVVVAGALQDSNYVSQLISTAQINGWSESQIHFTGFLSPQDAADLLAIADAVVLPFRAGSGEWNTSVHSALAQGTLVITTAVSPRGDEPDRNLYTAAPADIDNMRAALDRIAGRRISPISTEEQWKHIANSHVNFYKRFVSSAKSKKA